VSRAQDPLAGLSFDDPRLRKLRIGVQLVGDDGMNTPPAHALSRRGIIGNVRGYTVYGDYREPNPPSRIIRAVADREVDLALVWGPLAGYFAARSRVRLRIEPVTPWLDDAQWPMAFDISVGVRKDDLRLRHEIDGVLAAHAKEINRLLRDYGVPKIAP
jgi:mxaJ protein